MKKNQLIICFPSTMLVQKFKIKNFLSVNMMAGFLSLPSKLAKLCLTNEQK